MHVHVFVTIMLREQNKTFYVNLTGVCRSKGHFISPDSLTKGVFWAKGYIFPVKSFVKGIYFFYENT